MNDIGKVSKLYFEDHVIRVVIDDNEEPMFVAKDACNVLGITTTGGRLGAIPAEDKGLRNFRTPGGMQKFMCLNEAGLLRLIMRSNKPEALNFQNWVFYEVLPSIRKTGSYSSPSKSVVQENNNEQMMMRMMLAMNENFLKGMQVLGNSLNASMGTVASETVQPVDERVKVLEADKEKEIVFENEEMARTLVIPASEIRDTYLPAVNKNKVSSMCKAAGAETILVKYMTEEGLQRSSVIAREGIEDIVNEVKESISFIKETPSNYAFTSPYLGSKRFMISKKNWKGITENFWKPYIDHNKTHNIRRIRS